MQIVIDIPEEEYKDFCERYVGSHNTVINAMCNGTPLSKGDGRLIDADALGEKLNKYTEAPYQYALTVFNGSPTIIEADKMESEDKE